MCARSKVFYSHWGPLHILEFSFSSFAFHARVSIFDYSRSPFFHVLIIFWSVLFFFSPPSSLRRNPLCTKTDSAGFLITPRGDKPSNSCTLWREREGEGGGTVAATQTAARTTFNRDQNTKKANVYTNGRPQHARAHTHAPT